LTWNFQFGSLSRASYTSPALETTNLPAEQTPAQSAECRRLLLACLTSLIIDFLDTAPTLLPRLQILQPLSECYPLGTGISPNGKASSRREGPLQIEHVAPMGKQLYPLRFGQLRSEQRSLDQVGCEARKTPAEGDVFFLDFSLIELITTWAAVTRFCVALGPADGVNTFLRAAILPSLHRGDTRALPSAVGSQKRLNRRCGF
jgi:hypothetical protein